ncbi:MAG: DUF6148 family protein [Clostridium sp.]|nr:DUF6148 family protein [Clostridium sp.]
MSNTVLEIKKNRLKRYYEAEEKVLNSQSYTLGSKTLTRADLTSIQNMIKKLEGEISSLEQYGTTKRRSVRIVPVD